MKRMTIRTETGPYKENWDHLEDELRYLALRARRLATQKDMGNWIENLANRANRTGRRAEVEGLIRAETMLRKSIDTRLASTRAVENGLELGLDRLCARANLSGEERLLLLVVMLPGLSRHIVDTVLLPLNLHAWGRIAVEDALVMLDPAGPRDWVRYRQFLRPGSPLIKGGLARVSMGSGSVGPESLMDASVSLSLEAFGLLVGDNEMGTEVNLAEA